MNQVTKNPTDTHDEPAPDTRLLSDLVPGQTANLHTSALEQSTRRLLSAMGFSSRSRFRVCKTGDPFIVQVRSTRIGLARSVANRITVVPHH